MISLNKYIEAKEEVEDLRRKMIKMQIQCRNIRIGLRNNADEKRGEEEETTEKVKINNEYYPNNR